MHRSGIHWRFGESLPKEHEIILPWLSLLGLSPHFGSCGHLWLCPLISQARKAEVFYQFQVTYTTLCPWPKSATQNLRSIARSLELLGNCLCLGLGVRGCILSRLDCCHL